MDRIGASGGPEGRQGVKFLAALFGRTPEDPDLAERRKASEDRIAYLSEEMRNQQQALQSGSRRLRTMSRTMAILRDGISD